MGGFRVGTAVASGMFSKRSASRIATVLALLLAATIARSPSAVAQTATIRGFITDRSTGEALPGANARLTDEEGFLLGAVANSDGFYSISRLNPGRFVFEASYVGYATYRDTLDIAEGTIASVSVSLEARRTGVGEVVVDAAANTGATSVTAGLQTILPADIERIPSPDIGGDLAGYLTALPGVVTIGDQGGQFFIRGGEPWQNLVLLDGMMVYQPFHILGFFSAFPTEILNSVDVYAGGFGAKYGGRISSVIDVTARHGNKNRFAGSASLSSFLASVSAEGPLDEYNKYSFLVSIRQSVIEDGASRVVSDPIPYSFNDFFGKLYGEISSNARISISALQTNDRGTSKANAGLTPLAEIRWQNQAIGARYLVLPGEAPIMADFRFSYSFLKSELGPEKDPIRASRTSRFNTSADMIFYGGAADVRWGLFARTLRLSSNLGGLFQNQATDKEFVTEVGIYAEPEFKPSKELSVIPGLRIHSFPSKRNSFIEPRLRAVWKKQQHKFSAAFGLYHQEVVGVSDRRDATSIFTAWSAVPTTGKVPRAFHAILGYSIRVTPELMFSAEAYHKWYTNLSIAEWTGFPRLTTRLQPANGRARGLDLRAELQQQGFYVHLTYGLSWVQYKAQQASLQLWFGSNSFSFRPAHDRRHQINVLAGKRLRGLNFTARWQFGSGLPFSQAQGFDGLVLVNNVVDVFKDEGSQRVIFGKPFNAQLPTYHRLDLSAEYSFKARLARITLQASVLNVYDRKNVFSFDVFTQERTNQLPIIPSLGIKVAFQ